MAESAGFPIGPFRGGGSIPPKNKITHLRSQTNHLFRIKILSPSSQVYPPSKHLSKGSHENFFLNVPPLLAEPVAPSAISWSGQIDPTQLVCCLLHRLWFQWLPVSEACQ